MSKSTDGNITFVFVDQKALANTKIKTPEFFLNEISDVKNLNGIIVQIMS